MNNYCEWCRGRFPEEGCCLGLASECAWEIEQKEKEDRNG